MPFQGAPTEGIIRCAVADQTNYTTNVFFSTKIGEQALIDFESNNAYAVDLEHIAIIDKAKHCASIISYRKV